MWRVLSALLAYQLTAAPLAFALPQGPQVVGGAATLSQNGTTLQITQGTPKAIINWQGFSIGSNELVRFIQPGSSAVALNRVVGGETSQILGQLLANGRIFLINPNGIIFGAGAQVNVGSLLATTLNISDADFMAGNYIFRRESGNLSTIVNLGTLRAADGGFIALSAPGVVNQGTITARLGTVHLSSAERLTVDFSGDGLVRFAVNGAIAGVPLDSAGRPLAARVSNEGRISADGGEVTLTARAVADVLTKVVNNSGVIEARSLVDHGGVVRLIGGDDAMVAANANGAVRPAGLVAGAVTNTGTIDVSAAERGAAPGQVVMLGERVAQMGTIDARGADQARGGDVTITSTERTALFGGSTIDVSGRGSSDAGRVSVWSENQTIASSGAQILARGGEAGGNGGFIEVSGKESLGFAASVDALAPLGNAGTLLLDPHNIVVATGGAAPLTAVDQFTDTPAADATIAPAAINAAGANVVLQANNDITFTNAVAIAGAGIALTAQAGRSIIVNANVATNNAPISLTANETTANGVQNANRDVGTAAITMAAGTSLSSGGANITVTMSTGAGLTNSTSGNITLEGVNAGAGHVLIVNNGPTANSGIVRASANELITATSAALDVNGAAGGGRIGTAGAPVRVSVTNLEARSQSGGAFFTSPTLPVNIGGAALGGLTGISTSSNGAISVTTTATSITTTEALSANGTGTVTLTAAGAASSITANDAISSGSGAIALTAPNGITLSGTGSVATTGAYTGNADNNLDGTGVYTQAVGSTVASGAATIIAADVDLQGTVNAGAAAVTLRPGLLTETIGVADASKAFSLTSAELSNVTTTGTVTVGIATNTGGITIGTDALVNQAKALTFLSTGNIGVGANGLTDAGAVTLTTSGTGAITTTGPLATTGNKNIALTTATAPITTNGAITAAGSGAVTLTAGGAGTGKITANNAISSGSGTITLTADDIDINAPLSGSGALTLQPLTPSQSIGLAGGAGAFSLSSSDLANLTDGFSSVTIGRANGSGAITINAVTFTDPMTIRAPSGPIIVAGPITGTGDASIFVNSSASVGQQITLNAGITTAGQLISLDDVVLGANVTLDTTNAGASPVGGDITFRATTIDADSAANSRALTLTAGTGGAVTFPSAVGGTQALGSLTVSSSNTVTVAAVTTSGGIVLNAGGGGITMASGTTTSSSAGPITFTASGPITIASLVSGGDVTIDATGGSILALLGVTNITAGGSMSLTALGGTVGTVAAPITVAVTGPANMNATGLLGGVAIAANGTVGSTVPLFPSSVVGEVLWNGVDLNVPLQPPVNPSAPTTSTIGDLNSVIDLNAATLPVLVNTVVEGSLAPSLGVVPVIGFDLLSDVNPILALLSAQSAVTSLLTATLIAPLVDTPSIWYAETSTETETEDASSIGAAVISPLIGGRPVAQIRDGGVRLPAGLQVGPFGPLPSPDATSDLDR